MKRLRFTEEQIIAVLREQEAGAKAPDLCRKHGISEATLYNWKAKYGGMDVSDAKRLRALEDENGKLKKLLAAIHRCRRGSSAPHCLMPPSYSSRRLPSSVTPPGRRREHHLRMLGGCFGRPDRFERVPSELCGEL